MTADRPGLLDPLFRDEAVRLLFTDTARLQGMLDFEAALASAEATAGVIPREAADAIAEHCRADLFDRDRLAADAAMQPVVEHAPVPTAKEDRGVSGRR